MALKSNWTPIDHQQNSSETIYNQVTNVIEIFKLVRPETIRSKWLDKEPFKNGCLSDYAISKAKNEIKFIFLYAYYDCRRIQELYVAF